MSVRSALTRISTVSPPRPVPAAVMQEDREAPWFSQVNRRRHGAHRRAQPPDPRGLSNAHGGDAAHGAAPRRARLRQSRAWLRRLRRARQGRSCAPTSCPISRIVTAYNDMLSAHQPYEAFPAILKQAAREAGGVAQVAGGVPAMCDGVTQGRAGMEMSLFSRDVIALSAAIALSHDMFDAAVFLGVCDKIVPGLVIAAQAYGHLPAVFVPAGPMPSGISNDQKSKVRQLYAEGKVSRAELLEAEAASYHAPGTCTFYGTANSNQMLMEAMGLHLPGASFVNPNTPLRDALTAAAAKRALAMTALGNDYTPASQILDERAFVNGVVALHATGGSTNHVIHLVAMARAGGLILTLEDFDDLSKVVPLLTRIYPNGSADVNHFTAAGGTGYLIGQLLDAGLLHPDAQHGHGRPARRPCQGALSRRWRTEVPRCAAAKPRSAPCCAL